MEFALKQSFLLFMSLMRQDMQMKTSCSAGSSSLMNKYTMRRRRVLGAWKSFVTPKKIVASKNVFFHPEQASSPF